MKRLSLAILLAVALTVALIGSATAQATSVTVTLSPQNSSGQSGTATLTAMGDQTQVVVTVSGEPAGANEPEHIHTGSCTNLGAVKYPLQNLVNGTSTTTVNAKLSDLTTGGFAINGHKSAAEIGTYVYCGDIPAATAGASTSATTATATTTATTPSAPPATGGGFLATSGQMALPLAIVLLATLIVASRLVRRRSA